MIVRFLHDGVCWLLSAVLLLTNGWPVAIQHAHDVGGNPYHHSHRDADLPLRWSSIGDGEAVSGVTEHVHMLWLGLEVTIVPTKGCKPNPCPSAAAAGMLAHLVEKDSAASGTLVTSGLTEADMCVLAPILRSPVAQHMRNCVFRIAALPLCDTARHLRSGVQLI